MIQVGDTITFSGREVWWKRVAIRLGLRKPRVMRQYVVTWTTHG